MISSNFIIDPKSGQEQQEIAEEDYNFKRDKAKIGVLSTFLVLIKSTFSVGILVQQMYYFSTGYVLGTLLTFFISCLISYSCIITSDLADQIEKENPDAKIENLDDLALYSFDSNIVKKVVYVLLKICVFIFNYGVILVNIINMSKYFFKLGQQNFDEIFPFANLNFYKLCVFLVILLLIFVIVLPENLKYAGFIGSLVMIILMFYFIVKNFMMGNLYFPKAEPIIFDGVPSFIGNQLYSFEYIGTLLTTRSTMKDKSKMKSILIIFGIFIFVITTLLGFSFYFNFEFGESIVFHYYLNDPVVQVIEILFYLTCFIIIILVLISNFMMIENIKFVKNFLKSSTNNTSININKVIIFRLLFGSLLCSIIFFGIL